MCHVGPTDEASSRKRDRRANASRRAHLLLARPLWLWDDACFWGQLMRLQAIAISFVAAAAGLALSLSIAAAAEIKSITLADDSVEISIHAN